MDDLKSGKRNKRGHWQPNEPATPGPLFAFPPRPLAVLKWLPDYFLPWNVMFMAFAAATWFWLTPSMETMKTLAPGWILWILGRNAVMVFLFYSAFEVPLYLRRRQQNRFKYNPAFPNDLQNKVFFFGNQTIDSMIRAFGTGVPIWSTFEVIALWMFAIGHAPMASLTENPAWLLMILLLIPIFHEVHFYLVHRLIHVPILYKWVHSVHHNSVNPSPWSSLSMHPIEHLLYFSGVLVHLFIWSHPILAIYHLIFAGLGAVVGHIGFHRIETGKEKAVDTHAYAHYLHHKHFEVNYADGMIPLDKWFGTWHDGTAAGDEAMDKRWKKKVAKMNARS